MGPFVRPSKGQIYVADTIRTMPFSLPMLVTRLEDPRRVPHPRYITAPKLDGQRRSPRVPIRLP